MAEPLEATGNVLARVRLTCDSPDADLIVRLCDVYPDGRSFNICEGALRLRFRKGLEREEWLTEEPAEARDSNFLAVKLFGGFTTMISACLR